MKCSCGRTNIPSEGNPRSEFAIVLDAPMFEDFKEYRLLSGRIGEALSIELAKVGVDYNSLYKVPMHGHLPSKECTHDVLTDMVSRITHCKAVLMMGSQALNGLGYRAGDYYGTVLELSTVKPLIIPTPAAGILVSGSLGEFRLAFEAFSKLKRRHEK